jgi:RecA/RadA recombinase
MATKDYGFKKATEARTAYEHIPTGSFFLDILLGGGWIAGSSVEIYGQTQTGKTFLAQHSVAQVQKGIVLPHSGIEVPTNAAWVDMESQFDRVWAEKCGVDLDTFYTMEDFTFMEDALGAMITAVENRFAGIYVYDSVGASLPKGQLDKKIEDALVTSTFSRAKVMKVAMDSICHSLRVKDEYGKTNPSVVLFLNHAQPDIGAGYGYTSGGGDALKLLASTRLYFWNSNAKDNRIQVGATGKEMSVGQRCFFDVKKHRGTAAKEQRGWFDMYRMDCNRDGFEHSSGEIDRVQEVVDIINGAAKLPLGEGCEVEPGVSLKDGHYYNLPQIGKVHGTKQLYEALYNNPEVRQEVERLLVEVAVLSF